MTLIKFLDFSSCKRVPPHSQYIYQAEYAIMFPHQSYVYQIKLIFRIYQIPVSDFCLSHSLAAFDKNIHN